MSLLERTTAEVRGLRRLVDKYTNQIAKLEDGIEEYRTSNKLIDKAYIESVRESADLKVALEGVRQQLVLAVNREESLKQELAQTRKERDAARKRERIMGAIIVVATILKFAL